MRRERERPLGIFEIPVGVGAIGLSLAHAAATLWSELKALLLLRLRFKEFLALTSLLISYRSVMSACM